MLTYVALLCPFGLEEAALVSNPEKPPTQSRNGTTQARPMRPAKACPSLQRVESGDGDCL
jgi:hypothetical protein